VLASPVDARVLRVLERPGAHLTAGQPILELDVSQALRESAGLPAATFGQRAVGMPLPALLGVPVALAVTGEEDRRHGG